MQMALFSGQPVGLAVLRNVCVIINVCLDNIWRCFNFELLLALILWVISLVILHTIITSAVKQGVIEANRELIESVRAIERKLDTK